MNAPPLLAVVCLVAVAARLPMIWVRPPVLLDDEVGYHKIAEGVAFRGEYAVHPGQPTCYRSPGVPLFLASIYRVIGRPSVAGAVAAQALAAIPLCLAVAALARRVGGERAALPAAALAALHPQLVYYAGRYVTEYLSAILLTLGILACLIARERITAGRPGAPAPAGRRPLQTAFMAGLILGATMLIRPVFAFFPIVASAWLWHTGRAGGGKPRPYARQDPERDPGARTKYAAALLLGAALAVAPWAVRNARVFHDWVPLAANGGQTLWMGQNPRASGGGETYEHDGIEARHLPEPERDRAYRAEARREMLANPGRTLRLGVVKLANFWRPWPRPSPTAGRMHRLVAAATNLPIFVLAAVGAWRIFRPGGRKARPYATPEGLLAAAILYLTGIHMVFVAQTVHRVPIEPILCVFAGAAIARVREAQTL